MVINKDLFESLFPVFTFLLFLVSFFVSCVFFLSCVFLSFFLSFYLSTLLPYYLSPYRLFTLFGAFSRFLSETPMDNFRLS